MLLAAWGLLEHLTSVVTLAVYMFALCKSYHI